MMTSLTVVGLGGVGLGAGLGGEGEGELLAGRLADDGLNLVDGVGGVLELGNVEALVLNLVLTLDLGDLDGLGDADLLGGGVGQLAGLLLGLSDQGDPVGLGLVLLTAVLVLTAAVGLVVAVASGSAGCHLHGLGLLGIGDLGGGAGGGHIISGILVGADLAVNHLAGLLAHGQDLVEAVVIVHHLLDGKGDRGHLVGKGGDTDLSVDGGVGVPAVVLRGIAVAGLVGTDGGEGEGKHKQSLKKSQ